MHRCAQLIGWDWFNLPWAQTTILPVSTSRVATIPVHKMQL
jgi:hypothetical protein